jgi:hypothetical protein
VPFSFGGILLAQLGLECDVDKRRFERNSGKVATATTAGTNQKRKRHDSPESQSCKRDALIVLSLIALVAVLSGSTQPFQPDEGSAAHVFQLSIVAQLFMILVFAATADWKRPWRSARPLALQAVTLGLAFVALYHLEHP